MYNVRKYNTSVLEHVRRSTDGTDPFERMLISFIKLKKECSTTQIILPRNLFSSNLEKKYTMWYVSGYVETDQEQEFVKKNSIKTWRVLPSSNTHDETLT